MAKTKERAAWWAVECPGRVPELRGTREAAARRVRELRMLGVTAKLKPADLTLGKTEAVSA